MRMNTKVESTSSAVNPLDLAKYAAAILLVAAGIAGWYLLSWPTPVRVLVVILIVVVIVSLILAGFDWVISLGVRALLGQGDVA
jgi:hypothetical protein